MNGPVSNKISRSPADDNVKNDVQIKAYVVGDVPTGVEDSDIGMSVQLDMMTADGAATTVAPLDNGVRREYWIGKGEGYIREARVREVQVESGKVLKEVFVIAEVVHIEEGLKIAIKGVEGSKEDKAVVKEIANAIVKGGVELIFKPVPDPSFTAPLPTKVQLQVTKPVTGGSQGALPSAGVADCERKKATFSIGPTLLEQKLPATGDASCKSSSLDFDDVTNPEIHLGRVDHQSGDTKDPATDYANTVSPLAFAVLQNASLVAVVPVDGNRDVAKSESACVAVAVQPGEVQTTNFGPVHTPDGGEGARRGIFHSDPGVVDAGRPVSGADVSANGHTRSTGFNPGLNVSTPAIGAADVPFVFVGGVPPSVAPTLAVAARVSVDVDTPLVAEVSSREDDRGGQGDSHSSSDDQSDQHQPQQENEVA